MLKPDQPLERYDGQRPSVAVVRVPLPELGEAPPAEPPAGQRPQAAELPAIISGRRSVRQFQDRPVPREALHQMIEAAHWAPSPHGRQPWRFAILTTPEPKLALAEAMSSAWTDNLRMDNEPPAVLATRLTKSRERLLNSPALILACLYLAELDHYPDQARQEAETTMAVQSLGAAAQNILLTAYNLGLDSGWMCAPLFCPEAVRAALNLPDDLLPQILLNVGYAKQDPRRRPRRPASDLIVMFD